MFKAATSAYALRMAQEWETRAKEARSASSRASCQATSSVWLEEAARLEQIGK